MTVVEEDWEQRSNEFLGNSVWILAEDITDQT
jgi:hypothetical protein